MFSSVLWPRHFLWISGKASRLLHLCTSTERTARNSGPSLQQNMTEVVACVADSLCTRIVIWEVEATLPIKASIACWHQTIQMYRSYLLCSDSKGATVLIDASSWTYLQGSDLHLLQIDGVEQTKVFVDALCDFLTNE